MKKSHKISLMYSNVNNECNWYNQIETRKSFEFNIVIMNLHDYYTRYAGLLLVSITLTLITYRDNDDFKFQSSYLYVVPILIT